MAAWLARRLAGWLARWLARLPTGWLADRPAGWLASGLAGWLGRIPGWLADHLAHWLPCWLASVLAGRLVCWLVGGLAGWLACCLARLAGWPYCANLMAGCLASRHWKPLADRRVPIWQAASKSWTPYPIASGKGRRQKLIWILEALPGSAPPDGETRVEGEALRIANINLMNHMQSYGIL